MPRATNTMQWLSKLQARSLPFLLNSYLPPETDAAIPYEAPTRSGSLCRPHLLQRSLDVDPLAPRHSWVSQAVPSIPSAGYIDSLPPQALKSLSHHLHPVVGERRGVLVGGMETVRCQGELRGRQVGALSGRVHPGDENGSSGPGLGSPGQGCARKGLCLRRGLLLPLISQCCEFRVASYDFQREARILDFCVQSGNFKMLLQLEKECVD